MVSQRGLRRRAKSRNERSVAHAMRKMITGRAAARPMGVGAVPLVSKPPARESAKAATNQAPMIDHTIHAAVLRAGGFWGSCEMVGVRLIVLLLVYATITRARRPPRHARGGGVHFLTVLPSQAA